METIYNENKRLIRFYVVAAIIFSIMMCMSSVDLAFDQDVSVRYGGTFGATFEQAAEFAFGTSISPSYVMGLSSALSILRDVGVDLPFKLSFGLCDLWVVRILAFLWTALTMLTPVIGEEMEKINTKYVGPFMIFAFEFIAISGMGTGHAVSAAGFGSSIVTDVGGGILLAVTEFFKIIFMLCAYFFVRYFNYALSAVYALFTGFSAIASAIFRLVRAISVTVVLIIADQWPWVFYIIYAILLVISIFLFRWAHRVITYFKAIYIAPVKRKIFHKNDPVSLKVRKYPKNLEGSEIIIPVFSLMERIDRLFIKKRSKWYLAADEEGAYIYRAKFLRRKEEKIRLDNMYIREAGLFHRGFYEISDTDRKVCRLVFSREYTPVIDEIIRITGYGDYRLIVEKNKEDQRSARQKRREEIMNILRRKDGTSESTI